MYKLNKEKKCIKVAIAIYDEQGDKFLTQHSHLALSDKTINKIYSLKASQLISYLIIKIQHFKNKTVRSEN